MPDVPLHWYVDDAGHVVRIQVKPEEQQVIEDPAWVRHLLANPSDPISFYRFSDDIPVSVTGRWTSDPASPEFEHLRKFVVRSGGSVCYWPVRLRKGERQMRGVMRRIVDPADPDRAAPNAAVITYDFFAEDADSETGFEIIGMSGYYTFYRLGQDPRPEDTKAWLNLRLKESYEWTPPQESALSEWNRESYIRVINLELERHAEIFDKKWANMSRILQLTRDLGDQYEKRVAKIDDYLSETPRPEESSRRYKREIAIRLNREKFELAEMEKAVKDRANPK